MPQLDYTLMETQALVLGPTRELAQQIEKVPQKPPRQSDRPLAAAAAAERVAGRSRR